MIYLFNKKKELQRIVPRKHIISATQTVERNGVYQLTAEMPSFYVDKDRRETNYKKLVEDATFVGHYDVQKRFQIYKIYGTNLTADERGERLIIDAVHIFFDEAKALGNIHDRRFRDSEAKAAADVAFNAIGWHVTDYDVTDRHDINFYRDSVTNAWNKLIETFGVEFDYEVKFDGQKIVSKNVIMKKAIGRWTGERFAYGTNILSLTQEQDESEIYTAAVGRGRGEESGDGYGPRLEFDGIEWSKDGIRKPKGQNWIEIPSATQEYGFYENGEIKPRIAPEVVFENIENPVELANATYQWLLENCVPKATWTTNVAKIGELNLGDGVAIIYKRAGIVKQARVEKIEHNLLDPSLSKLTLGDFKHFKNRQLKRLNSQIKRANRDARSLITQLKEDFDAWFNAQVIAFRNEFEQAKIDILAEVEADRARMEAEFNNTLDVWTNEFNQDVENAMKYAEEQAKAHADVVEGKLDEVTVNHKGMLDELKADVMDIDDFLGDSRALTLDERFNEATKLMEDRIRNINVNSYNMLQGTRFDESSKVDVQRISGAQILTTQHVNRIRLTNDGKGFTTFEFTEPIKIEANTNYYLTVDYLTDTTPELDYLAVETPSGWTILNNADTNIEGFMNLKADGKWNKTTIRINTPTVIEGKLRMGTRWNRGEAGTWIDVRQPYLTNTSNREWLPHPNDATQSIEMVTRRMTELEDGLSDYITRSEFNFDTGNLEQYIKSVEENVEGNKQILQKVENWQSTNGASIEETVYGFNQKVWLNDFSEINANLVPQSSNAWEQGSFWSSGGEATDSTTRMNLRTKEVIPLRLGERYTISDYSTYPSNVEKIGIHQWDANGKYVGLSWLARGASTRFTAIGTKLRLALHARNGFTVLPEFVDEPDKRIQIKLEHGSETTPMLNALSRIEQLADSVSIKVQELDGEYLTESDIQVKAGYIQLGSKQLGDEQFASIFRVSPKSIDAITDNLNLSGNLNVKGQIEAMALNAINVNAGTVRSYILESNVITGDHLAVGTSMINKLFATSGRIDQLIGKDYFIRNIKALSIEAVEGNFSSLVTKYFSANYIDVDWINGKNAWFESMYTSNAMIRKLTAQTVFVRDVQAIEITANQLNLDTLRNRFNQIEGGLHITRAKDGVRWIENGVPRGNVPVQTYDSYAGSNIRFNGLNYITDNSNWQTFKYFYTPHEGRILRVVWAVGLLGSSGSASEYVEVKVNGFGNNNQINNGAGSSSRRVYVSRGDTVNITQDIPLPPPNYNMMQAYLQVRRSPSGTGVQNDVFARILHIGQYG